METSEQEGWRFANGWEWTSAMRYFTGFDKGDAFTQWAPGHIRKILAHLGEPLELSANVPDGEHRHDGHPATVTSR